MTTPPTKLKRSLTGTSKATGARTIQPTTAIRPSSSRAQRPRRYVGCLALGPAACDSRQRRTRCRCRRASRTSPQPELGVGQRPRNDEAALVEEDRSRQADRVGDGRQLQEERVDQDQLDEQRRVAHDLDVAGRDAADQPVARQPRDPDDDAQDRGEHDADDADQQRVEQTGEEGLAVGVARRVRDDRLRDVEAGGCAQESRPKPSRASAMFASGWSTGRSPRTGRERRRLPGRRCAGRARHATAARTAVAPGCSRHAACLGWR